MTKDRDRTFSILSLTALSVDVLVVFLFLFAMADSAFIARQLMHWGLSASLFPLLALPFGLVVHYFVVEIVFSGHSIGRFCTGLSYVNPATSTNASISARLKRLGAIVLRLGLGTFSLSGRPACDRSSRCTLSSDWLGALNAPAGPNPGRPRDPRATPAISSAAPVPVRGAHLEVLSGPQKGHFAKLTPGVNKGGDGVFVIGRDPQFAQLVLASDPSVSRVHCRIAIRNGQHFIVDGSSRTSPSSHGTKLNGQAVTAASATPLRDGAVIDIGQSKIIFRAN